jgi:putative oxidoreductase
MRPMLGIHRDWGLAAIRVAMGSILALAGYRKWVVGVGVVSSNFAAWGIPLPELAAPLIALLETAGGLLLVLGLWTRWLGLAFAAEFVVATFWVKYRLMGWDAGRLDLMLLAGGVLLFLGGPGKAALQRE